jgi:uncharacterized damage-inducible protein DinB
VNTSTEDATSHATIDRMDEAWAAFRERVHALPTEQLEQRVAGGGWTRKQMLAHITAWHERTIEAINQVADTGEPPGEAEETDAINARAARAAVGRTTGEVLAAMEDSYRQVRRTVDRLTDVQLAAHDGWVAAMIAGNTYDHYAEHLADLAR